MNSRVLVIRNVEREKGKEILMVERGSKLNCYKFMNFAYLPLSFIYSKNQN